MTEYGRIHIDGSRSGGQPVLKPCPTNGCEGGKIEVGYHCGVYYVECDACGGQGDLAWNEREAVANWNRRLVLCQPTPSDALREALRFYAREANYRSTTVYMSGQSGKTAIEIDGGQRARAALEQSK